MSFVQFKDARIAKGWNQKQLAYFAGLSVDMVRKLEHGKTNPRVSSLVMIAAALGLNVKILLERDNTPQESRMK